MTHRILTLGAYGRRYAQLIWFCLGLSVAASLAHGAPTARSIAEQLFRATREAPLDLSGAVLENLDLSGLDFKRARLDKAKLFGADLSQADLSGSDLRLADLNRVTVTGTRFDEANLEGATLLRPSAFTTLAGLANEAPSFRRANMRGVRMFGRFVRANFSGAVLNDATCAPFGKTGFIEEIWRTEFTGSNLSGAQLERANLTHALLSFADLKGANLRHAILKNADLTGADLSGADLTGADVSGADLADVKIKGAIGLASLSGLASARNADKVIP